ncbi:MAG: 50S ribosomal protein L9, partial [Treponema sp.]|nr:50S ribosomal protein L9 [Treponema sp.]
MKVILNVDVKYLGEEGDVKNVATGYARNYLLPRNLAVPYNEATVMIFEARKAE